MTVLQGVYPPVLTPFRGRAVAHDGLASNLPRLNAHPLSGYVVLGQTASFRSSPKARSWRRQRCCDGQVRTQLITRVSGE